jgi:hypothetical protein
MEESDEPDTQMLYPWGKTADIYWIRGWVNPRAHVDTVRSLDEETAF